MGGGNVGAIAEGARLAQEKVWVAWTGLMAPAWRLLHVSRGVIPDLTWTGDCELGTKT